MTWDKETQQLYWIYSDAKYRCTNPEHKRYKDYGGRGIQFKFDSFKEWLNYVGKRPDGYTIDRIDNNGHYEVGNIRWATSSEQQKNKRMYTTNTSGIKGVNFISTLKVWIARINLRDNGHRKCVYKGPDFFEACCARKSWELHGT